jgi:phage-related tail protein
LSLLISKTGLRQTKTSLQIALADKASSAPQYDDEVKELIQRYQQVEAQLDRSVRYSRKTGSEGDTTIQQAWYNGAGDPIKVAVEHISSAGRELTEYLSLDFDDPGAMFVLTRKETTQPDGGTQIDESRQYFGNDGKLVRELRKSVWGSLVRTLIGKGSRMRIFRGPILQTDGSPTTGLLIRSMERSSTISSIFTAGVP